jgi:DNA mismatch repair protein MSH6
LLANSQFAVTFDNMAKKLPDLERMLSRIHGKTIKKADFCTVIAVRASRLVFRSMVV